MRPLIFFLLALAVDPRLTRQQVRNLTTHAQKAIAAKDLEPRAHHS